MKKAKYTITISQNGQFVQRYVVSGSTAKTFCDFIQRGGFPHYNVTTDYCV